MVNGTGGISAVTTAVPSGRPGRITDMAFPLSNLIVSHHERRRGRSCPCERGGNSCQVKDSGRAGKHSTLPLQSLREGFQKRQTGIGCELMHPVEQHGLDVSYCIPNVESRSQQATDIVFREAGLLRRFLQSFYRKEDGYPVLALH